MERKTNPDLHIICGKCGCGTMLEFEINPKGNESTDGKEYPAVYISCNNCSTLTGLDEIIEDKTEYK